MALALAGRGYAEVTIADIVREAAVSRRTFYEHFTSKADCLIALYEAASRNALGVLRSAIDPARDWHAQVEQALGAYFDCLAANPALLRTLFIEILGLGREGLAARRRLNAEIATFMREVVNAARPDAVGEQAALAVVGGIHELVLAAIEQDPPVDLRELVRPASALVRAVAG